MTNQEIIEKLKSYGEKLYGKTDKIGEIYNLLSEFENNNDCCLPDNLFRFKTYDYTQEYITNQIAECGLERIPYLLGKTEFNSDYYCVNAYGNIENITDEDVLDMINEALQEIDYILDSKK